MREGNQPYQRDAIVRALSSSVALTSPVAACETDKRMPLVAQTAAEIVGRQHRGDDAIDLSEACLQGARLANAKLSHADLSGSDLRGADRYKADLLEANLRFVNLGGASLISANMRTAGLYCTFGEKARKLAVASETSTDEMPLKALAAQLHDTSIVRTSLAYAKFAGTLLLAHRLHTVV